MVHGEVRNDAGVPVHLEGISPDGENTFADWRADKFLETCAKVRGGGVMDYTPWRLGVVNGCFDLLHLGHINLTRQALYYETDHPIFLVALLNSDESVRRLKGPHRPIMPLAARMWSIWNLHGVNLVAGFAEDTPEEALSVIKPDVLFKGAEYDGQEVAGARHCGRVVFLPETPGYRTSDIERRIVAAHGGPAGGVRDGSQT